MKHVFKYSMITGLVAVSLAVGGCATAADEGPVAATSGDPMHDQAPVNGSPAAVMPPETNQATPADTVTNPGDANSASMTPLQAQKEKLDKLRVAGSPDASAPAAPIKRPAPDNSEYWSTLTDVAVETREFRGHPQIAKVERIIDGSSVRLKIYRKDGKVVQLDDRVKAISAEPVATFVTLAGLQPANSGPPARERSAPGKKGQADAPARDGQ